MYRGLSGQGIESCQGDGNVEMEMDGKRNNADMKALLLKSYIHRYIKPRHKSGPHALSPIKLHLAKTPLMQCRILSVQPVLPMK